MCSPKHELDTGSCTAYGDSNCLEATGGTCQKCMLGYTFVEDTACNNSCNSGLNGEVTNLCTTYATAPDSGSCNGTCDSCNDVVAWNDGVNDKCCPLGYHYDTTAKRCVKSPEFCSQYDGTNCTSCFYSVDYCLEKSSIKYHFEAVDHSFYPLTADGTITKETLTFDTTKIEDVYYNLPDKDDNAQYDTGRCCPLGKYYDALQDSCVTIEIDNCS